jgi:putative molybdopterin biosynthesis protein
MQNTLRTLRRVHGMSQSQLAEQIGVSRQTIQAIEAGQVIPSTLISLRLARIFGVHVEDIFQAEHIGSTFTAVPADPELEPGDRVITANIGGKWIAHHASSDYGQTIPTVQQAVILGKRLSDTRVKLIQYGRTEVKPWTILCGCDPALGLLAGHISQDDASNPAYWINRDNASALRLLREGKVQAAAVHLPASDANTATTNFNHYLRIHLAAWELGWVVRRGNPCGFSGAYDLADGRIKLVNRPLGSGARTILDDLLCKANVPVARVAQYHLEVPGHLQVAAAVEAGIADVGIAIAGAARMRHLDFIPIQRESCDLFILKDQFNQPGVQRLLDCISSDVYRWDLERFGPYDVSRTGKIQPS